VKFLCEHCKAKYQIADDKVAGRTVRMKCRKCGNQIEVRAAVTETSVSSKLPQEAAPPTDAAAGPGGGARPGQRAPRPLATSLSGAGKASTGRTQTGTSHDTSGALAGAFQRNVQREEEISVALDLRELSAADEWYVAINGVPVGPVRVAELRRKAALGVVTEDSLCWQEGMEEWRPVRSVTELAALVREAAAGGRISLLTPPPPEARPGPPAPPPRAGSMRPGGGTGFAPGAGAAGAPARLQKPAVPTSARSNVVPITSRLATAEKLDRDFPPHDAPSPFVTADPFASPPPASAAASLTPSVAAASLAPSFSAPVGAASYVVPPTGLPPVIAAEAQRKPPPWILIAMFVLAGAFGITAAILVFKQTPVQQVLVPLPSAAAAPPTTNPPPALADLPPAPTDTVSIAANDAGPGKASAVAARGGTSSPSKGSSAAATDPALRDLINGTGSGPSAGPNSGAAGGSGAQLTEDQVKSVLANHKPAVTRTCWERMSSTPPSVNSTVHIVVAPSGQVTSASAQGNDPAVGHCIENEVRRWTFPGGGVIDIPFHFVHQ
jgi:predicted Zn finger-like uncharacterized protein